MPRECRSCQGCDIREFANRVIRNADERHGFNLRIMLSIMERRQQLAELDTRVGQIPDATADELQDAREYFAQSANKIEQTLQEDERRDAAAKAFLSASEMECPGLRVRPYLLTTSCGMKKSKIKRFLSEL